LSGDADQDEVIYDLVLRLCDACEASRTLCPTDVAKALAAREGLYDSDWRSRLGAVRRAAVRLAEDGRIAIYRKGKPVDPRAFRGVYRLGGVRGPKREKAD
jgi:Protein of unknown function (DUF3253)